MLDVEVVEEDAAANPSVTSHRRKVIVTRLSIFSLLCCLPLFGILLTIAHHFIQQ